LKTTKKDKKIINKFITLDIETRIDNYEHVPYCICYFDGKKKYSFYVTDFSDYGEMLKTAIESLLKPKYSGYVIYAHNLSNFDGIFLLKTLTELADDKIKITPILRDGNFINIKATFGSRGKYNLSFRDSYLLLPVSLRKLSEQFSEVINQTKTIFPYYFLNDKYNSNINLNYEGKVPAIKYFDSYVDNLDYTDYLENYKNSKWSLRKETIDYCLNDCVSLHEVLVNFNKNIFTKFKLNIHGSPTLPALTFNIFRSNFLPDIEKEGYYIPLILGEMYEDLKKSYTGGSTDMYIPKPLPGVNAIYCYDVNSLYPTSMKEGMMMPVISRKNKFIRYFEGDINNVEFRPFGFLNCEINTTKHLKHPILQVKRKIINNKDLGGGVRTISPLGNWKGMYFSEELNNAEKYGYKYKFNSGYIFEQKDVFAGFIDVVYDIKQKAAESNDSVWYLISKLFLNSLYGRFGMDPNFENHVITKNENINSYLNKYKVIDFKQISDGKVLISYIKKDDFEFSNFKTSGNIKNINVSVSISSAITAYARMFMSKFKNNPNYNLYYTDTDSVYTDKPLVGRFIGTKLGQFKLENVFTDAVFLAPKVYGGITEDGKEINKIKGYKNKISFDDLKSLLKKDKSLEISQEKWFKSLVNSKISIKDQIYTLAVTENKRKLIFDDNDYLIDTEPLVINEKDNSSSALVVSGIADDTSVPYSYDNITTFGLE